MRMSRYRGVVTSAPTPALPEIIQTGLVYADQATGRGNTSVGAMAASVLMDVLRNGSERDVDDLLERLLTHPGNHAGNTSLINGMSGDGIGRGATSSKVDIARHSLSSARGWSLLQLQAKLLDTLRARLVDPLAHPRSCEPVARHVLPLGDDYPVLIRSPYDGRDRDNGNSYNNANSNDVGANDNENNRRNMTAQSTTSKDFLTSIVGEINGGVPAFQRDVAEVLLDTLLVTLRGDKLSLSHVLLGLAPALDSTYSSRWDIALNASFSSTSDWRRSGGNNHPNLAVPTTVLGQILLMLEDSVDIITQQPSLAALCYEIIYSLCKLKYTSSVVLSYLRISRVNVGGSTMKFRPILYDSAYPLCVTRPQRQLLLKIIQLFLSLDTSSSLLCTAWVLKPWRLSYALLKPWAQGYRNAFHGASRITLSLH